jgi:hypothetical protein
VIKIMDEGTNNLKKTAYSNDIIIIAFAICFASELYLYFAFGMGPVTIHIGRVLQAVLIPFVILNLVANPPTLNRSTANLFIYLIAFVFFKYL